MRLKWLISLAAVAAILAVARPIKSGPANADYPDYNGDPGGMHYSALKQISPANVGKLREVWRYDLGAAGNLENTPIIVDGTLYGIGGGKVFAVDAATGHEKWTFALRSTGGRGAPGARGETWWTDGHESRLFVTANNLVYALDPEEGTAIAAFGDGGKIDLNANLRGDPSLNNVHMGGPVTVYKDMFFTNGGVGEQTPASPGDIRAWDVHTGKMRWVFHTIPYPNEPGADTWPKDAYLTSGGANGWPGAVIDVKRGILFEATGSPSDDYYGGERLGKNIYGDCVFALDANTGKLLWSYQAVHHDLWDDDFAAPPVLIQVKRHGKLIDAVAATNKTSFVYIFDRVTGEPLFPINEVPAPPSHVPGDVAWPTQPRPTLPLPLARQTVSMDELTTRSPEANEFARAKLQSFVNGPEFTPPAYNQETIVAPGFSGGSEWGGMAFDPNQSLLFANTQNIVWTTSVVDRPAPTPDAPAQNGPHSRFTFSGYNKFYDQDGYPATAAPWGYLTAINVDTGKFAWRIPFGEYPELVEKGITNTGSENYGAGIATASGLFIIAATNFDRKFHAYNSRTGELLWSTVLPYSGNATPATYMLDGKQYVVIGTSGSRNPKGPKGGAFVAFALPD